MQETSVSGSAIPQGAERFDGVLFDHGRTLFHHRSALDAVVALAAEQGCTVSTERAAAALDAVHASWETTWTARLARNRSAASNRRSLLGNLAPLDAIAPGLAERYYVQHETNPRAMVPYPDTAPVLHALAAQGVPVGIVSNTGWDIREVYDYTGLRDLISSFTLSCEHDTAKPDPALFRAGCAGLGTAPGRTLMVGNDPVPDGGAIEAGCVALILPPVADGSVRGLGVVLGVLGVNVGKRASLASDEPRATTCS